MKRVLAASALFVAGFSGNAFSQVNLNPQYHTIDLGGTRIQRVYFADGAKKYAVTINEETEVTSGYEGAVFRFKTISQAEVSLRPSPLKPDILFSAERLPDYLQAARKLLGVGSEIVEEAAPALDVYPVNQWKSCRFTFKSKIAGANYTTDVTFLNFSDKQQVVIVTSSKPNDFEEVRARADKLIKRWHEVLPGDEAGTN